MITLRKLSSLKEGTRRRKFPLLLQQLESEIKNGKKINVQYFQELLKYISSDEFYHEEVRNDMFRFSNQMNTLDKHQLLWKCNSIRYQLLSAIDAEPGDWDFEENESIDRTERIVGDMALFLDGIRSPFNVGSIFRSAESFGIKHIYISRETSSPEYQRAKRSSMGCTDIIPWSYVTVDELPEPIFTLELGGQSLNSFPFPEKRYFNYRI